MGKIIIRILLIIVVIVLTISSFIMSGMLNEIHFYIGIGLGFLAIVVFVALMNNVMGIKPPVKQKKVEPEQNEDSEEKVEVEKEDGGRAI